VIGVPGEMVGGLDGAGAVNVLYGTPSLGLQVDDPADARKTLGTIGVEGDPTAGDSMGAAVEAG
jgi:hypothetical protein